MNIQKGSQENQTGNLRNQNLEQLMMISNSIGVLSEMVRDSMIEEDCGEEESKKILTGTVKCAMLDAVEVLSNESMRIIERLEESSAEVLLQA